MKITKLKKFFANGARRTRRLGQLANSKTIRLILIERDLSTPRPQTKRSVGQLANSSVM